MTRRLRPFNPSRQPHLILAIGVLSGAIPAAATNEMDRCVEVVSAVPHELTPASPPLLSITPHIQDAYTIDLAGAGEKTIRLLPDDRHSVPESFEGKVFDVVTSVDSREHAHGLFTQILEHGPKEWTEHGLPALEEDKMAFDLPGRLRAYVRRPNAGHEVGGQAMELVISMDPKGDGPAEAKHLLDALNAMKLRANPDALKTMPLSTHAQLNEWAKYSFAPWAKSLTSPERRALDQLSSYHYSSIHDHLRAPGQKPRPETDQLVKAADEAIQKGVIDRDIKLYRSDSSPHLHELWTRLSATPSKNAVPLKPDPAFTFTSVNRQVATWWNQHQLKNKGVLLEIEVPAQAHGAYLDSAMHDRGYMEMILPRKSKFEVMGASTSADGHKVLRVRLVP